MGSGLHGNSPLGTALERETQSLSLRTRNSRHNLQAFLEICREWSTIESCIAFPWTLTSFFEVAAVSEERLDRRSDRQSPRLNYQGVKVDHSLTCNEEEEEEEFVAVDLYGSDAGARFTVTAACCRSRCEALLSEILVFLAEVRCLSFPFRNWFGVKLCPRGVISLYISPGFLSFWLTMACSPVIKLGRRRLSWFSPLFCHLWWMICTRDTFSIYLLRP